MTYTLATIPSPHSQSASLLAKVMEPGDLEPVSQTNLSSFKAFSLVFCHNGRT